MTEENDTTEQLPSSLIKQLKAADQPGSMITAKVDRHILQMAESQFASPRPAWQRRPAWAAIAATVLIAVFASQFRESPIDSTGEIYADVDQSGRIDIADVLATARARGGSTKTQAELDAFAMRVVSLTASGETS